MTLYDVLGVSQTASIVEIKKAYRRMVMINHPDRNKSPGSEEKTKKINLAYETLSDPIKRKEYDASLREEAASQQPRRKNSHTSNPKASTTSARSKDSSPPPRTTTTVKRQYNRGNLVFWAILGLIFFTQLISKSGQKSPTQFVDSSDPYPGQKTSSSQPERVNNTTTNNIPSTNGTASLLKDSHVVVPTNKPDPKIDCTGPDGKHMQVTQQECDNFNNAWRPAPTPTSQPSVNYNQYNTSSSCGQCGTNSHCSYGNCVCDNGYVENYSTNTCDKLVCPANATISSGMCVCNDGYTKNYSTNQCDPCPANSIGTSGSCTCKDGFQKNYLNGQCEPCPANSIGSSGVCTCRDGYQRNYLTGQCDVCPPNSTGSGGTCTCNNGYIRNYMTGQCDVNKGI